MALPVTISSVTFPDQNYLCGPFKSSSGNIYAVFRDGTFVKLAVVKASDPTVSFSIQDNANAPSMGTFAIVALWVFQDGDDLKIVTAGIDAPEYRYHVFHMATDLWDGTLKNETIEDVKDSPATANFSCSTAVRSDDDVVVLYNGDTDAIMGTAYERVDYAVRVTS